MLCVRCYSNSLEVRQVSVMIMGIQLLRVASFRRSRSLAFPIPHTYLVCIIIYEGQVSAPRRAFIYVIHHTRYIRCLTAGWGPLKWAFKKTVSRHRERSEHLGNIHKPPTSIFCITPNLTDKSEKWERSLK